jgi:hypothetical protein
VAVVELIVNVSVDDVKAVHAAFYGACQQFSIPWSLTAVMSSLGKTSFHAGWENVMVEYLQLPGSARLA